MIEVDIIAQTLMAFAALAGAMVCAMVWFHSWRYFADTFSYNPTTLRIVYFGGAYGIPIVSFIIALIIVTPKH
jgi:hypothetical protein